MVLHARSAISPANSCVGGVRAVRIAPSHPQFRSRVHRMIRIMFSGLLALALTGSLALAQSRESAKLTPEALRGLTLRNLKSTLSSGRIADVVVDPRNRHIWYVASASGGVWKTTNGGLDWFPVFDEQASY